MTDSTTNNASAPAEPVEVPIVDLVRSREFQARKALNKDTVRAYATAMERGEEFPPVEVAHVEGAAYLVDGFHRVAALETMGRSKVLARVTKTTREGAKRTAALANLRHALPLKKIELKRAFVLLVEGKGHVTKAGNLVSYRKLAEMLGGHARHTTVRLWMQKEFPRIAAKYGTGDEGEREYQEQPGPEPQAWAHKEAADHLDQVRALLRAVTDGDRRRALVAALEGLLEEAKAGAAPWVPPEPVDF